MPTYKTTDGLDYTLPEHGQTKNGQITVPDGVVIENARFELVNDAPAPQVNQPPQPAPAPAPSLANAATPAPQTPTPQPPKENI